VDPRPATGIVGRDQHAQDEHQFTDPDPDQKIDERPGRPAEESDGIAQPDQRSRQTLLESIGKICDRAPMVICHHEHIN